MACEIMYKALPLLHTASNGKLSGDLGRGLLFSSQSLDLNHLTTNDDYSRHRNSAACYQLAQSVLKIGSALAERVGQGEVGGCTALADSAWRLLQLAIERAWSALDGPFFCFLVQTSVENGAFTLYGLHFWLFRQFSVWRSVLWSEGSDY